MVLEYPRWALLVSYDADDRQPTIGGPDAHQRPEPRGDPDQRRPAPARHLRGGVRSRGHPGRARGRGRALGPPLDHQDRPLFRTERIPDRGQHRGRSPGTDVRARAAGPLRPPGRIAGPVSYTHLRAHETDSYLVCRLLL